MKSLALKVGIILLMMLLFVFIGYLEIFGVRWIHFCENLPPFCYPGQHSIVDTSKNIVEIRVESVYEGKSPIEIGARLGHRWYPKSGSIPIILLVGGAVWGTAIIFVLGTILYIIVVEPIVKKRQLTGEKDRQKQASRSMDRFGEKIFRNGAGSRKNKGGAIGYGAVFDKVFFETIFSHHSMLLPCKFLMGPTGWIFSVRE